MTDPLSKDDLEGLEKRLRDAALRWDNGGCVEWPPELEPSTLMHQAAEALSRLRAERDEVESWCEMHRQDRIHAENSRYAYLQAFRASEKQIRLLRETLEPFAAYGAVIPPAPGETQLLGWDGHVVTVEHFRRAFLRLAEGEKG